jgi:hypothetical protein
VTDWSTIASLATAAGTLVLAVATFAAIRSANRSARISERAARTADDVIYLAVSVRNVGNGVAVLHGWHITVGLLLERSHPPVEDFTMQNLDIYVAPGDIGLWLGALREPAADTFTAVADAFKAGEPLVISLLYGDFEGGQRVITQLTLRHGAERCLAQATRHFNVDRPDPR